MPKQHWTSYGPKCGRKYRLLESGWWVLHCGHPTALWPYYGVSPTGEMIIAPNGRGFRLLADAKETIEKRFVAAGGVLP